LKSIALCITVYYIYIMLNASISSAMKNPVVTLEYATVDFVNGSITWNYGCYLPKLERKIRSVMSFWGAYQDGELLVRIYGL
jgi:hypothetical protein